MPQPVTPMPFNHEWPRFCNQIAGAIAQAAQMGRPFFQCLDHHPSPFMRQIMKAVVKLGCHGIGLCRFSRHHSIAQIGVSNVSAFGVLKAN
jgi:hypothetical protein